MQAVFRRRSMALSFYWVSISSTKFQADDVALDLPLLNGMNTDGSLTSSGWVVHLSGKNSFGRAKTRSSNGCQYWQYAYEFHLGQIVHKDGEQSGKLSIPLNNVCTGTHTMTSPGMYVLPIVMPSGGDLRWVPDGTAGCRRSVSLITASSNLTPLRLS